MFVHNPDSHKILSASWIRSDSLEDSLTWDFVTYTKIGLIYSTLFLCKNQVVKSCAKKELVNHG
jgi:hypothetical protein